MSDDHAIFMDALTSRLIRTAELKKLNCNGKGLGDADIARIAELLPQSRCLMQLDFSANAVTDAGVASLLRGLQGSSLQAVRLSDNAGITDSSVEPLLGLLQGTNVHTVDLSGTSVTEAGQQRVEHRLLMNSFPQQVKRCLLSLEGEAPVGGIHVTLTYDALDPKVCTQRTVGYLAEAVRGRPVVEFHCVRCLQGLDVAELLCALGPSLASASFREIGIGDATVEGCLAHVVQNAPVLRTLDLRDNEIGNDGARLLTQALSVSDTLDRVLVSGNPISPAYCSRLNAAASLNALPLVLKATLPAVLRDDTELHTLALRGGEGVGREAGRGYFDNGACRIVCEALQRNTHVTELDLRDNHIGPEGAMPLAELVECTKTLKVLRLCGNTLGDDGAKRIIQAMALNDSLTLVSVEGCAVSQRLSSELLRLCTLNSLPLPLKHLLPRLQGGQGQGCDRSVTEVDFSTLGPDGRALCVEGTAVLCTALKANPFVTSLNASGNSLGDEGACCVARLLGENKGIKTLKLCDNGIGKDGAAAILRSLRYNNSVTSLNLSANKCIPYELRDEIDMVVELNFLEPDLKETVTRLSNSDQTLTEVQLSSTSKQARLKDDMSRTLSEVLVGNRQITAIRLDRNSISSIGLSYLCRWLHAADGSLKTFSICHNELDHEAAAFLSEALLNPTSPALEELLLRGNALKQKGGEIIARLVANKPFLLKVDVAENGISAGLEAEIRHLCTLNSHPGVKPGVLELFGNSASQTAVDISGVSDPRLVEAVVFGLSRSKHVESLVARGCGLQPNDCATIAAGLRGHPALRCLDLRDNPALRDFEANMLAEVIENSGCAVREVSLGGGVSDAALRRLHDATLIASLPQDVAKDLMSAKQNHVRTTALRFSGAGECSGDAVCQLLQSYLVQNTFVTEVHLASLGISDSGAQCLADLIQSSSSLQHVDVRQNPIGVAGLEALVKGLCQSQSVKVLQVEEVDALRHPEQSEEGLFAAALCAKLAEKLAANSKVLTLAQHRASAPAPQRRLVTTQLEEYRTKEFMEAMQAEITQDALRDNKHTPAATRLAAAAVAVQ